jgi:hypothetical protein
MRSTLSLAPIDSRLAAVKAKLKKVKQLQDQYNAEYPAYAKDCLDETSGSARMLTGEKLTDEQMATSKRRRKNETRGASQRPTVLQRFRNRFLPHSSNAVSLFDNHNHQPQTKGEGL